MSNLFPSLDKRKLEVVVTKQKRKCHLWFFFHILMVKGRSKCPTLAVSGVVFLQDVLSNGTWVYHQNWDSIPGGVPLMFQRCFYRIPSPKTIPLQSLRLPSWMTFRAKVQLILANMGLSFREILSLADFMEGVPLGVYHLTLTTDNATPVCPKMPIQTYMYNRVTGNLQRFFHETTLSFVANPFSSR